MSEQAPPSTDYTVVRSQRYTAFIGTSCCVSDEKDQDRARVQITEAACYATVCDGATQSLHSADAAEIVSRDPAELWDNGEMSARVELLRARRRELIASASSEPDDDGSFLSRAFATILHEKRQQAFQTTVAAVRISPLADERVLVEAKTCGDSAFLVFDERGRLILSNLGIDESAPFNHVSSLTEVLPDHFNGKQSQFAVELDHSPHVVLCSDGFYDAFLTPAALFRWLLLNCASFSCEPPFPEGSPASPLYALHARLEARRGDDDISVVWLCPHVNDPSPADSAPALLVGRRASAAAATDLVAHILKRLTRLIRKLGGGTSC